MSNIRLPQHNVCPGRLLLLFDQLFLEEENRIAVSVATLYENDLLYRSLSRLPTIIVSLGLPDRLEKLKSIKSLFVSCRDREIDRQTTTSIDSNFSIDSGISRRGLKSYCCLVLILCSMMTCRIICCLVSVKVM